MNNVIEMQMNNHVIVFKGIHWDSIWGWGVRRALKEAITSHP